MKHICFLTSTFGREDPLIVIRQGKSLVDAGYKVTYLLCDGLPSESKYGMTMISVDKTPKSVKDRIGRCTKAFKKYIREDSFKADLIQISEPELLPLGLDLKKMGFKVVYNLREWYPDYYARKVGNKLLRRLVNKTVEWYLTYVSKRYDGVFSCMPEMRDYIKKVMPCKYFEDVANFPIVNKYFSISFEDYSKRDNIISYFGSIYNISCQEEFLDAIDSIPNVKYLLAGIFYSDDYKNRVMAKPGWKKVTYKNGFKREELSGILNCSVMGNVMKDFNQTETPQGSYSIIKIFESMEAAIPVILAKVPLYEKMVEKYNCGICVDPHNPEEIRKAIIYLLEHKEEAYQMGQNGRRAVIEEFSWDSQVERYLKVIKELTQ